MSKSPVTILDSYEPDYGTKCEVCGQTPCVTGVKNGKVLVATGMCGPCTWGESACLDPAVWNDVV